MAYSPLPCLEAAVQGLGGDAVAAGILAAGLAARARGAQIGPPGQGLVFHAGHEAGRQLVVQVLLTVGAAGFDVHFMDETAQAEAGHTGEDVGIGTDVGTGKGRSAHGMILGRVCAASPAGSVDAGARGRAGAPVPAAGQGQKAILARGDSGLKPEEAGWPGRSEPRGSSGRGREQEDRARMLWERYGAGDLSGSRGGDGIRGAGPALCGGHSGALAALVRVSSRFRRARPVAPSASWRPVWDDADKKEHPGDAPAEGDARRRSCADGAVRT